MASKAQLRERWTTPAGKAAVAAIEDALRSGSERSVLEKALAGLPLSDEVAPALDFRGIEIPSLLSVRKTDLSGARFDGAKIGWSFSGSVLREAVFDAAEGRNVDFGGCDLGASSFVKAKLPGAIFFLARLRDAGLTGIRMRGGQLKDADCTGAKFEGADLRIVWAAGADLRGANLSGANLIGASLGGAKWDETTRFDGARLSLEGTPADLRGAALLHGAALISEKSNWEISLVEATARALEEDDDPRASAIASRVRALKPEVERDAKFPWSNILREQLDAQQWPILEHAVRKAATNIGALLG